MTDVIPPDRLATSSTTLCTGLCWLAGRSFARKERKSDNKYLHFYLRAVQHNFRFPANRTLL